MKKNQEDNLSNIMNEIQNINSQDFLKKFLSLNFIVAFQNALNISKKFKFDRNGKFNKEVDTKELRLNLNQIDKNNIVNLKFKSVLEHFINVICEDRTTEELKILYKNINNLKIKEKKNLNFYNIVNKVKAAANYDIKNNIITVIKNSCFGSIYHELLHAASSKYKNGKYYSGFYQVDIKENFEIGLGLNEGYTTFLDERYFIDKSGEKKSYGMEKRFAELVERIIGKEKMEEMYFKADLQSLIEELKQYDCEENIIAFLKSIDTITRYFYKNKFVDDKYIENHLNYVSFFLSNCYTKKQVASFLNGEIDDSELKNSIGILLSKLNLIVTDKEGKDYNYLDINTMTSIIVDNLSVINYQNESKKAI